MVTFVERNNPCKFCNSSPTSPKILLLFVAENVKRACSEVRSSDPPTGLSIIAACKSHLTTQGRYSKGGFLKANASFQSVSEAELQAEPGGDPVLYRMLLQLPSPASRTGRAIPKARSPPVKRKSLLSPGRVYLERFKGRVLFHTRNL